MHLHAGCAPARPSLSCRICQRAGAKGLQVEGLQPGVPALKNQAGASQAGGARREAQDHAAPRAVQLPQLLPQRCRRPGCFRCFRAGAIATNKTTCIGGSVQPQRLHKPRGKLARCNAQLLTRLLDSRQLAPAGIQVCQHRQQPQPGIRGSSPGRQLPPAADAALLRVHQLKGTHVPGTGPGQADLRAATAVGCQLAQHLRHVRHQPHHLPRRQARPVADSTCAALGV